MSQETLILKLAQAYLEQRKASAVASVKRTLVRWGFLYFALLFFFVAFVGLCLSIYLGLEPILGRLRTALWITTVIAGLGLFCVIIAQFMIRPKKPKTNSPEMAELCAQLCKEIDVNEVISKHGLKIAAALFVLGFLGSQCKRK